MGILTLNGKTVSQEIISEPLPEIKGYRTGYGIFYKDQADLDRILKEREKMLKTAQISP